MGIFGGFDRDKLKTYLQMSIQRLKLMRNKKVNELRIERRSVSEMLGAKQYDKARIRGEAIIRKEREAEASDILELMCELLATRISLISSEKHCPPDLAESVHTVIWATPRAETEELHIVKQQLIMRYGEKFCLPAIRGAGAAEGSHVNEKIQSRLTAMTPDEAHVVELLVGVAKEFGVEFDPKCEGMQSSRIGLAPRPGAPGPPPPLLEAAAAATAGRRDEAVQQRLQPAGPGPSPPSAYGGMGFLDPLSGMPMGQQQQQQAVGYGMPVMGQYMPPYGAPYGMMMPMGLPYGGVGYPGMMQQPPAYFAQGGPVPEAAVYTPQPAPVYTPQPTPDQPHQQQLQQSFFQPPQQQQQQLQRDASAVGTAGQGAGSGGGAPFPASGAAAPGLAPDSANARGGVFTAASPASSYASASSGGPGPTGMQDAAPPTHAAAAAQRFGAPSPSMLAAAAAAAADLSLLQPPVLRLQQQSAAGRHEHGAPATDNHSDDEDEDRDGGFLPLQVGGFRAAGQPSQHPGVQQPPARADFATPASLSPEPESSGGGTAAGGGVTADYYADPGEDPSAGGSISADGDVPAKGQQQQAQQQQQQQAVAGWGHATAGAGRWQDEGPGAGASNIPPAAAAALSNAERTLYAPSHPRHDEAHDARTHGTHEPSPRGYGAAAPGSSAPPEGEEDGGSFAPGAAVGPAAVAQSSRPMDSLAARLAALRKPTTPS